MTESNWWEALIYFISIIGVSLLANLSAGKRRESKRKFYLLKKISLGIVIFSAAYWIITFPYAGRYYNFSVKSEYPAEINSNTEAKYIQEHHQRIEALEREVEETREEVRAIRERLTLILQLAMYGIVFYGCNKLFNSKNEDLEEVDEDKVLKL